MELQVNFLGIESTYDCFATSFCSCSALHNYIRARCNIFERVILAGMSSSPSFTRLILCPIARLSVLGSSFVFREWSYAITLVIFNPVELSSSNNFNCLVCLDTAYRVILVGKTWITKKLFF